MVQPCRAFEPNMHTAALCLQRMLIWFTLDGRLCLQKMPTEDADRVHVRRSIRVSVSSGYKREPLFTREVGIAQALVNKNLQPCFCSVVRYSQHLLHHLRFTVRTMVLLRLIMAAFGVCWSHT